MEAAAISLALSYGWVWQCWPWLRRPEMVTCTGVAFNNLCILGALYREMLVRVRLTVS
jgi:hypothetical protein